jgi:hypothetical protein
MSPVQFTAQRRSAPTSSLRPARTRHVVRMDSLSRRALRAKIRATSDIIATTLLELTATPVARTGEWLAVAMRQQECAIPALARRAILVTRLVDPRIMRTNTFARGKRLLTVRAWASLFVLASPNLSWSSFKNTPPALPVPAVSLPVTPRSLLRPPLSLPVTPRALPRTRVWVLPPGATTPRACRVGRLPISSRSPLAGSLQSPAGLALKQRLKPSARGSAPR